ncbi:MAG TPA: hypothetical protein VN030_05260 [Cellvibrio sp.]|nr:hypothetical protein [Cellvibrio sp.]
MLKKHVYLLGLSSTIVLLTACGGGSSSSKPSTTVSTTSSSVTPIESNATLVLPTSLEVVTNESNPPTGADSASDYTSDEQRYHVWNESLKPIELVNSILCFTSQFKANDFVNAGPYLVLADEKSCFKDEESGGESAQSAGAGNTPTYMKVIVNATRGTGATDPIEVKVWMPEMGGGEDETQAIKFKAVISKGANAANPFGSFTFNYAMFDSFTSNNSMGGGEIKTVDIPNKIGFTLYEIESGEERTSSKNASVVMSTDRSSGIALTSNSQTGGGYPDQGNAFGLSFNSSNVLLQTSDTYANLPFKSGNPNSGEQSCLSRTEFTDTVNRYDLYNKDTGARVTLNSGVSFKYDSDDEDTAVDGYGHVGYWGVWTDKPNSLQNGASIEVETPGTQQTQTYTVIKAPGRLIKNTVEKLTLDKTKGIEFSYWSPDAQQQGFQNWVVKYLTAADDSVAEDGFYKVGGSRQGEQGPMVEELEEAVLVTSVNNQPLQMNSQQLGGNVKYKFGDSFLMFFKQEFVNGSESTGNGLFANGSATLYCIERCPVGTLGATELQSWDSPYSSRATTLNDKVAFTINNSGVNALALVRASNSQVVKYAGVTEQSLMGSPYSWGLRSGSLVTEDVIAQLTEVNQINNPDIVNVFYEWETGLNSFNQTTSIKDSNGVIKTFDKPIQIAYTHTDTNDRSGDAGDYDNKTVMLNYGGNGQLWGIPSRQSDEGRYQPLFNIADGTLIGDSYKIKARDIEGVMQNAPGHCDSLILTEPAAPVPTAITGNADIGDMPIVTSAPAVIGGVIQTAQ